MSSYICIFMDETEFLESQVSKPLVWIQYIDDVKKIRKKISREVSQ